MARLYPPYFAVLIIAALCALLKRTIPYDMVIHLLSAQNYHWMITGYKSAMQPMTAHTWTLSIEVWSGLIWLLLLKCLSKDCFKRAMIGALFLGMIYRAVTIICGANVWIVSLCPLAHFDAFACGSLLAIGVREEKVDNKVGILGLLGFIGIVGCIIWIRNSNGISFVSAYRLLSSSENYLNNWFTGSIYLFISLLTTGIIGLAYIRDENRLEDVSIIEKVFVKLGDNSYVLYLFHWPIRTVLTRLVHLWGILFPVTFIASIGAVSVYNWLYTKMQKKLSGGN